MPSLEGSGGDGPDPVLPDGAVSVDRDGCRSRHVRAVARYRRPGPLPALRPAARTRQEPGDPGRPEPLVGKSQGRGLPAQGHRMCRTRGAGAQPAPAVPSARAAMGAARERLRAHRGAERGARRGAGPDRAPLRLSTIGGVRPRAGLQRPAARVLLGAADDSGAATSPAQPMIRSTRSVPIALALLAFATCGIASAQQNPPIPPENVGPPAPAEDKGAEPPPVSSPTAPSTAPEVKHVAPAALPPLPHPDDPKVAARE